MTDEFDEFETDANNAEEMARPDTDLRAAANGAAGGTEPVDPATGSGTAGAKPRDDAGADADSMVPGDIQKYIRFRKVDSARYDRVNDFLRERTCVAVHEWAIARLCADFRTETGVEMMKIRNNLLGLVPFMADTYTPQTVNQVRSAFRDKARKSGATSLYGAMSGFFTAEEPDGMMYEVTEIARFLSEVKGIDLSVGEELEAEEHISSVVREVREASTGLRQGELSDEE